MTTMTANRPAPQRVGALSPGERDTLALAERTIEAGLRTFMDVGLALSRIRDERLYRERHETFEAYCQARWNISGRRAYQLIDAADVSGAIMRTDVRKITSASPPKDVQIPSQRFGPAFSAMATPTPATPVPPSEYAARPLARLLPEPSAPPAEREQAEQDIRDTWDEVVRTAPRRNDEPVITARHVEQVVAARTQGTTLDRPVAPRHRAPEASPVVTRSMPVEIWSDDERLLQDMLNEGRTVVVSTDGRHAHLVAWAEARGLLVPIGDGTIWANPFRAPDDGDRQTVAEYYGAHYLPYKRSLMVRLASLKGKALADVRTPSHGDVLAELAMGA